MGRDWSSEGPPKAAPSDQTADREGYGDAEVQALRRFAETTPVKETQTKS